jgi:hypothetical protein
VTKTRREAAMIEVRARLESARYAGSGQPTGKRVYFNALDRGSVSAIYSGLMAFANGVPAQAGGVS